MSATMSSFPPGGSAPPAGSGPPSGSGPPAIPNQDIDMNLPAAIFFPPIPPEQLALLPHDDKGPHLIAATWVLVGLATLFLALRVYCKAFRGSRLWWDDYVLIASYVCFLVSCCIMTVCVTVGGYGKHVWDVGATYSIGTIIDTFKRMTVMAVFQVTASSLSKTSFAITLLRLTEGWTKASIWVIMISMNVFLGVAIILPWVQCQPVTASWNFLNPGKCWPVGVLIGYNTFATSYSAAMDITLALIPWKVIWGLQMRRVEKIGVGIAMGCGVFAGAVTIVKAVKTPQMSNLDPSQNVDLMIWAETEVCVTIIAASIPVLRVLLREVKTTAQKYYLSHASQTNNSNSKGGSRWLSSKASKSRGDDTLVSVVDISRPKLSADRSLDDWSDKSILRSPAPAGYIKQASEINIEHRDRTEAEFEMGPIGNPMSTSKAWSAHAV